MLVKKGLQNVDELERLFAGKTAHGERGFSTAMARTKMVNDLFEGGEGEAERVVEDNVDGADPNVYSDCEVLGEKNPTNLGTTTSSRKRKASEVVENKKTQPNLDTVLDLLYKSVTAPDVNKIKTVSLALREMGVSKERGDRYFVAAMRYLGEGNNGDIFLALENDNQKWMFLDEGMNQDDTCYIPRYEDE